MTPAKPITLWAVIGRSKRSEWIIPDTVSRTRRAARDAYNGGPDKTDWFSVHRKKGWLRLDRVVVSLKEAPHAPI